MACISSNDKTAKIVIRKTARLASYYNSDWFVLYVQTPRENSSKIPLHKQRHLINNFKLATQLGGEIIRKENSQIADSILKVVEQKEITTVCIGKPHLNLFKVILFSSIFYKLLNKLSSSKVDLIILS